MTKNIEKTTDEMRIRQDETESVKVVLKSKRLDRFICAKLE
jgi:hypothetical protein